MLGVGRNPIFFRTSRRTFGTSKPPGLAATPEHWGRTQLPEYLMQYGLYTRGIKKGARLERMRDAFCGARDRTAVLSCDICAGRRLPAPPLIGSQTRRSGSGPSAWGRAAGRAIRPITRSRWTAPLGSWHR